MSADYHASAAWAAKNEAHRKARRVQELEEEVEFLREEVDFLRAEWRRLTAEVGRLVRLGDG